MKRFIVKNKKNGLYWHKGDDRSWFNGEWDTKRYATLYLSISGIKNSMGKPTRIFCKNGKYHAKNIKDVPDGTAYTWKRILSDDYIIEQIIFGE